MAELVVPPLGESITEAVVAKWLKNVGEPVAADEPVAELEADKITVQLASPASGSLAEQRAAVGATVKVGDVIGTVTAGATAVAAAKPAPQPQPAAAPASPTPTPTPTPTPRAQPAPPPPPSGNGQQNLDKNQILRLTPSQRVHAREAGSLPSRAPAAAPQPDVE